MCEADLSQPLHYDKSGSHKMLHKPLGDDLGQDFIRVVHALTALVA